MQQQFENPYFVSPDFMYNQMMQNQQQQEVQQKMVDLDTSKLPNVEKVKEAEINVFKDYADKLNSQPKKPVETQEVNMVNIETNDDQLFKTLSNYRNLSDNNLRESETISDISYSKYLILLLIIHTEAMFMYLLIHESFKL